MKFVDEVSITVSSGKGGPGKVSFLRASMQPRGGPDGGDGGRGGNVVFRVTPNINTLVEYRYQKKFAAKDGEPGAGTLQTGSDAEDLILPVPLGTIVRDAETNEVLADLSTEGDFVFLTGGRGGKGNTFFKTSINQAPDRAQPGEPGQSREIKLELKLIADVGVIGYPNAGKSTFISRVSAAKPKIADYPFTTLTPNLGVVRLDEEKSIVVADIPGLVPGAHKGVGLGTQFLRHIERTRVFIHLVDVSGVSGRDPVQDYRDIMEELRLYDESKSDQDDYRPLLDRKQIVALNKIDTLSSDDVESLVRRFKSEAKINVRPVSAVSGKGIQELVREVGEIVFEGKK